MSNIITAAEVRKGDLIRVTRSTREGDRKRSRVYEGVAFEHDTGNLYGPTWRTKESWNLYTREDDAVIELLDRPEPELAIPTLPGAVVQYKFMGSAPRTAIRGADGSWKCYDDEGDEMDMADDDDWFRDTLRSYGDYDIVFAGVAK